MKTLDYSEYRRITAEAKEVLRKAETCLKIGWTQGASARDGEGNALPFDQTENATTFCLTGAIMAQPASEVAKFLAMQYVFDAVKKDFPLEFIALTTYNDLPGRTQEEVIKAVQKARGL